jgi:hypothetical protein
MSDAHAVEPTTSVNNTVTFSVSIDGGTPYRTPRR